MSHSPTFFQNEIIYTNLTRKVNFLRFKNLNEVKVNHFLDFYVKFNTEKEFRHEEFMSTELLKKVINTFYDVKLAWAVKYYNKSRNSVIDQQEEQKKDLDERVKKRVEKFK